MVGERPRLDRLEHVVVEHEVLRVRPVVGDLTRSVVPHDIWLGRVRALGIVHIESASLLGVARLRDEPVHRPAVDVEPRVALAVWSAAVYVCGVVVGLLAASGRDSNANGRYAILHGDAVRTGVGPEVTVEGPVLLLDDDDVLDLVDSGRDHVAPRRPATHPLDGAADDDPHAAAARATTAKRARGARGL